MRVFCTFYASNPAPKHCWPSEQPASPTSNPAHQPSRPHTHEEATDTPSPRPPQPKEYQPKPYPTTNQRPNISPLVLFPLLSPKNTAQQRPEHLATISPRFSLPIPLYIPKQSQPVSRCQSLPRFPLASCSCFLASSLYNPPITEHQPRTRPKHSQTATHSNEARQPLPRTRYTLFT